MISKTITPLWSRLSQVKTDLRYRKYYEWGLPLRDFIQVNIETTTICTRTCHFCLYGVVEEVPATRMASGLFFSIIDELAAMNYSGRLSLFNINEPLTDRRIFDFLFYARTQLPKAYHALVSNGDLLDPETLKRLFDSGLDHLMVNSYDAMSKQRNLDLIESSGLLKGHIHHMDRTEYTAWHSRAGNVGKYYKAPATGYCELPNYVLYIKPNGEVLSCCNDFHSENVMGNVSDKGVLGVWRGAIYDSFRQRLNRGDRGCSSLCEKCDYVANVEYFKFNDEVASGQHRVARDLAFPDATVAKKASEALRSRLMDKENMKSVRLMARNP